MKRYIIKFFLFISLLFTLGFSALGQPPLPPGDHDDQDDWQPAPIGGGLVVLVSLAAMYGAKKVYDARKKLAD